MRVTEHEIDQLRGFIAHLNAMRGSAVVVEGKRDACALQRLGFSGKVLQLNRFGGMVDFADSVARYESVIILFDRDKKGSRLTGKAIRLLERRTRIDLSFKKRLRMITRGQVMFTEQLVCYEPYLA